MLQFRRPDGPMVIFLKTDIFEYTLKATNTIEGLDPDVDLLINCLMLSDK